LPTGIGRVVEMSSRGNMRVIALFVVAMALVLFTANRLPAQHFISSTAPVATAASPAATAPCPDDRYCPTDESAGIRRALLHRGCCGCGTGCDSGNCACHGSYKYPVPSQYTYFWPGIYSQQTMTQYVSPWRYPDLNPIPEHWKTDPTDDTNPYAGYRY
jgi:hypothetical protein